MLAKLLLEGNDVDAEDLAIEFQSKKNGISVEYDTAKESLTKKSKLLDIAVLKYFVGKGQVDCLD